MSLKKITSELKFAERKSTKQSAKIRFGPSLKEQLYSPLAHLP